MTEAALKPCADWAQCLAARHQDDLSPTERAALKQHLASCQACSSVYAAYHAMEAGISNLPIISGLPGFSYQPLQPKRKEILSLAWSLPQGLIITVLAILLSLFSRLSWSGFYQQFDTWISTTLTSIAPKAVYVHTNSQSMYALRSDSGLFLWQQKRRSRNEFFSSLPIRWSGFQYVGSGIALVGALDFCKYAVRA